MSSYSIFTYQFQRILKGAQTTLEFADLPSVACTNEDWVRRQELFGSLFEGKDFRGEDIQFQRGETMFIHEVLYNKNGIVVMKFANPKKRKINNIHLTEAEIDDYPWCYVIWDNRDGIQRLLVERKPSAWPNTKKRRGTQTVAELLAGNFDLWMSQRGMHFEVGDGPTYPRSTFWEVVGQHPEGFSRVHFSFPPLNLGRLLNLADNVDAIRYETGGGFDADLRAAKDSVLMLSEQNPQTASLVNLSSAGGFEVKAYVKGGHTYVSISGDDKKNPVVAEIPDGLLPLLKAPDFFHRENLESLTEILNSIKTLYD